MNKFHFVIKNYESDDGVFLDICVKCLIECEDGEYTVHIEDVYEWLDYPQRWEEWPESEWIENLPWLMEKAEQAYKREMRCIYDEY